MGSAYCCGEYSNRHIKSMITTYSNSALAPRSSSGLSGLGNLLAEPLLVVGVSTFWFLTLPFVAASLFCVRIWDTITSRPNPLILRRSAAAKSTQHRRGSAKAAHV